jgi:uncharacterized protein
MGEEIGVNSRNPLRHSLFCDTCWRMGKKEIIEIIRDSKPELQLRYGVQQIGLFGSYVREEPRLDSDIDILVSFSREIDLFEFIDLRDYLESRLHDKVDLVMATALKPSIGKRILTEVEYV